MKKYLVQKIIIQEGEVIADSKEHASIIARHKDFNYLFADYLVKTPKHKMVILENNYQVIKKD